MTEWRTIPGFDGMYEITDDGRVRSWRNQGGRGRRPPRRETARELTAKPDRQGYMKLALRENKRSYRRQVHQLVLLAWVGPPPPGHQTGHLDGDPSNNSLSNLRWVTVKENAEHRRIHGTLLVGERTAKAKLTEGAVVDIRARVAAGERSADLAIEYQVRDATIRDIRRRDTWKHVA